MEMDSDRDRDYKNTHYPDEYSRRFVEKDETIDRILEDEKKKPANEQSILNNKVAQQNERIGALSWFFLSENRALGTFWDRASKYLYGEINKKTGLLEYSEPSKKGMNEIQQSPDDSKKLIFGFVQNNPAILSPKTAEKFIQSIKEELIFAPILNRMKEIIKKSTALGGKVSQLLSSNDPIVLNGLLENIDDWYNAINALDGTNEEKIALRSRLEAFKEVLSAENGIVQFYTAMQGLPQKIICPSFTEEPSINPSDHIGQINLRYSSIIVRTFLKDLVILTQYVKNHQEHKERIGTLINYIKKEVGKTKNNKDYMASIKLLFELTKLIGPICKGTQNEFDAIKAFEKFPLLEDKKITINDPPLKELYKLATDPKNGVPVEDFFKSTKEVLHLEKLDFTSIKALESSYEMAFANKNEKIINSLNNLVKDISSKLVIGELSIHFFETMYKLATDKNNTELLGILNKNVGNFIASKDTKSYRPDFSSMFHNLGKLYGIAFKNNNDELKTNLNEWIKDELRYILYDADRSDKLIGTLSTIKTEHKYVEPINTIFENAATSLEDMDFEKETVPVPVFEHLYKLAADDNQKKKLNGAVDFILEKRAQNLDWFVKMYGVANKYNNHELIEILNKNINDVLKAPLDESLVSGLKTIYNSKLISENHALKEALDRPIKEFLENKPFDKNFINSFLSAKDNDNVAKLFLPRIDTCLKSWPISLLSFFGRFKETRELFKKLRPVTKTEIHRVVVAKKRDPVQKKENENIELQETPRDQTTRPQQ